MAISEIQDFIHIGIDRCPNEINKLFSNEIIFKYLKTEKNKPCFTFLKSLNLAVTLGDSLWN
mgnify:CR=1 FL=1